MRYLINCLAFSILLVTACQQGRSLKSGHSEAIENNPKMSEKSDIRADEITMKLSPIKFDSKEEKVLIYTIVNSSDREWNSGRRFQIERKMDNGWKNVAFPDNLFIPDVLDKLFPGQTTDFQIYLSRDFGKETEIKGLYRLTKQVWKKGNREDKKDLVSEFTIE